MTNSCRKFRKVFVRIVRYWHKSKGPSKNDELQAQNSQEETFEGQREDELLAHLSQGVSEKSRPVAQKKEGLGKNHVLLAQKSKGLSQKDKLLAQSSLCYGKNDALIPQKSQGLSKNYELLAQKSQSQIENDMLLALK